MPIRAATVWSLRTEFRRKHSALRYTQPAARKFFCDLENKRLGFARTNRFARDLWKIF